MRNFIIRSLVALFVGPVIVYIFYVGGWALAIPLGLLSGIISLEMLLFIPNNIKRWRRFLIALSSLLLAPFWYLWQWEGFLTVAVIAIGLIAFTELTEPITETRQRLSFGLFSFLYPAMASIAVLAIHEFSPAMTVYILISIWICDTFAYFVGIRFGRHNMSPSISPNKTWEGLLGATIGGMLAGVIFSLITTNDPLIFVPLGLMIAIIAQLGDLVESKLKREVGLKDSSNLIPGHGGFLDRFDSFLFVYPIAYLILHNIFT